MRRMLLATLALSPVLLHAQAIVPAQPQTSGSVPALQSKLVAPKPFETADRGTLTSPVRVSTGIVPAKLVYTVPVAADLGWQVKWQQAGPYRSAVVEFVVDEKGKPSDVKIVKSAGSDLDRGVLNSVAQYRFQPATVSSMPIAMGVTMTIDIRNPFLNN